MSILRQIPLLPETTDQIVTVELDNRPFTFRILWNERFGYFSMSIFEANGTPIVQNLKMVKNYELLRRFKSTLLPFDELYFIQENGRVDRPGYSDLAVNFGLYYFEPDIAVTPALVIEAPVVQLGTIWDSGLSTWDGGSSTWDQ